MKIGTLLSKCMLDLFVNFDKDHWIDYFQSVVALLKLCELCEKFVIHWKICHLARRYSRIKDPYPKLYL